MKPNKATRYFLETVLAIATVFAVVTIIRAGFVVDEYGALLPEYGRTLYYLWAALVVPFSLFIIFHSLYDSGIIEKVATYHSRFYKVIKVLIIAISIVSAIISVYSHTALNNTIEAASLDVYSNVSHFDTQYFKKISLDDLDKLSQKQYSGIVYITRTNCRACLAFQPKFQEVLEDEGKISLVYNTSVDREDYKEALTTVMEKYSIATVPTVLIFHKGDVKYKFDGKDIVSDVISFFDD